MSRRGVVTRNFVVAIRRLAYVAKLLLHEEAMLPCVVRLLLRLRVVK